MPNNSIFRITLNFEDCYVINPISDDLTYSEFDSELTDGNLQNLKINIGKDSHPLLPQVLNLAFGPLNSNGDLDDSATFEHANYSKMFSTIIFQGLTYLSNNPDKYIGIDGSDNARAFLYYRMIRQNYDYLNDFFEISGVSYYIRILREVKKGTTTFDRNDIQAIARPFSPNEIIQPQKMYNYFIFRLK